jgi:hexosaminidase
MKSDVGLVVICLVGAGLLALGMRALAAFRAAPAIVPRPKKLRRRWGKFRLGPENRIVADAVAQETGHYLAERLRTSTGYRLPVIASEGAARLRGDIVLTTREPAASPAAESYRLAVSSRAVVIRASGASGLFYGVQSFLQLLPLEVFAPAPVANIHWRVRGIEIEDEPRFRWRGFMLDVSRHFFSKAEIKRVLDAMALHKLNTFHWHLTDDQGWRVEIKKYPRLTELGAWRKDIGFKLEPSASTAYGPDGRYGGYYSQDDIREIVAHAQARHITIVPEIEMPGHASAALAAYPEFGCTGGPHSTDGGAGVFAGVFCAGREESFAFLQDVLEEVSGLFPGQYIHIGGDEVPKQNWRECARCQARRSTEGLKNERELQSYFVQRIGEFLGARGRRLIGWSEIREGGLPENAALMDWIGGAVEAATAGHEVVRASNAYCYFDYYQSRERASEPRATAAYLPLSRVYSFEPIPPELAPEFRARILGAQGNLWTEYIPNLKQAEYMTFPRLCALAEVVWSAKSSRNWKDFARRLRVHCRRLDCLGINFRRTEGNNKGTK